jgi:four helix bundle protein
MAEAIENLRIYKQARTVEDEIYELVKTFPADQFYGLGNDLRRSSAAVSHHIMEAHRLFSYRLKIDALTAMRREVEGSIKHLAAASDQGLATTTELIDQYTSLIKQSWALTRWLKNKLEERQRTTAETASREIVA